MYTENGLLVDLVEVEKVVDLCDVFTVIFGLFPERLVVDTRHKGDEGPLVALVEPVASVQERFFWLGQRRPAFGPPENFMFFVWPHSIEFFEESGVAARIGRRCQASGYSEAVTMFEKAMAELRQKERKATLQAVTGEGFRDLWPAEEDSSP